MKDGDFTSDHQRIEERSIALHQAIGERLQENPELLAIAEENLSNWEETLPRSQEYFSAWRGLLKKPLQELLDQLVSTSQRMKTLRQSSPFCGILTPKERWQIYESYTVGAYYSSRRGNS